MTNYKNCITDILICLQYAFHTDNNVISYASNVEVCLDKMLLQLIVALILVSDYTALQEYRINSCYFGTRLSKEQLWVQRQLSSKWGADQFSCNDTQVHFGCQQYWQAF